MSQRIDIADVLVIAGALLVTAGVAQVSIALATIFAGASLVAAGLAWGMTHGRS